MRSKLETSDEGLQPLTALTSTSKLETKTDFLTVTEFVHIFI